MLFARFGLGIWEIVVLGLFCATPLLLAAVIIPLVLVMTRRPPSAERWREYDAGPAAYDTYVTSPDKKSSDQISAAEPKIPPPDNG